MKRRNFLKNTLATGAALGTVACQTNEMAKDVRDWSEDQFELAELSISELSSSIASGKYTIETIIRLYLDRIQSIDKNGPKLNSVIEVNPDAISIARRLDDDLKKGEKKGPLHGIPIMLKDNIDTYGKMMTTAGSLALEGNFAKQNAFVAQKLEEAGAVIIGKTNLSEWANFRSTRSSSGWSGRGGQTRNPYITDRNPCGSSSGSGVAVSANLCAGAIGTETNGSIVCPSSANGVVGIKPTVGLVSRSGIIPISHTHDTAGPMCRSVADAALILGAITGIDPSDRATSRSEGRYHTDYSVFVKAGSLHNKKLGVVKHYSGFHSEVDLLFEKAKKDLTDLGATIVEIEPADLNNDSSRDAYDVLLFEFKHDLNAYLANCPEIISYRTLEEIIAFNIENAEKEMPYFGQEIFIESQSKEGLDSDAYKKALDNVLKSNGPDGIDRVLDKYSLDAIIAPTGSPAWPIDLINGDHFIGSSSSPAARSGYPNITVPMGFIHGLPVGISIFAEAFSESKLIGFAYDYEQATKHRKAPEFIPTFGYNL